MKAALAARYVRAVELGHVPEWVSGTEVRHSGRTRLGLRAVCSCGWEGRLRPTKNQAVATFLWHLEQVLDEEKNGPGVSLPEMHRDAS